MLPNVWLVFYHHFTGFFTEQKFLILMKSNLSISPFYRWLLGTMDQAWPLSWMNSTNTDIPAPASPQVAFLSGLVRNVLFVPQ